MGTEMTWERKYLSETSETTEESPAGTWRVLRCAGPETGELEDYLVSCGVRAWTPRTWVSKRLPRRRARVPCLISVLPSYVFVSRMADLTWMHYGKGFSYMSIQGKFVIVSDADLEGLRAHDNRDVRAIRREEDLVDRKSPGPDAPREIPQDEIRVLRANQAVRLIGGVFGILKVAGFVEKDDGGSEVSVILQGSGIKVTLPRDQIRSEE